MGWSMFHCPLAIRSRGSLWKNHHQDLLFLPIERRRSGATRSRCWNTGTLLNHRFEPMKDPWDERYIYLHECLIFYGNMKGYMPFPSIRWVRKQSTSRQHEWKKCMNMWQHVTTKSAELFAWRVTLPETDIARENRPSRKETSLPTIHFQGLC